jgi:hypothetical protein
VRCFRCRLQSFKAASFVAGEKLVDLFMAHREAPSGLGGSEPIMEQTQNDDLGLGIRTGVLRHPILNREERHMSRDMRDICGGT